MRNLDQSKIEEKIIAAIVNELEFDYEKAAEISFHMTDWLKDLEELASFFEEPEKFKEKEVSETIMRFLVHAPNHLAAASKLYTGFPVTDIFEVDAVSNNKLDED